MTSAVSTGYVDLAQFPEDEDPLTGLALPDPEETQAILDRIRKIDSADALELACKAHLGVWAERKRGFTHAEVHWEWNELAMTKNRLAVVAPREHAKSETFTVNQIAWRCIYEPGIWCYVFAQTGEQAQLMKARIDDAVSEAAPWLTDRNQPGDAKAFIEKNTTHSVYANYSIVDCAGSGKAVRGVHPDVIVGDDVLEEGNCLTSMQRKRVERWWFGSIGGMSHPGTTRTLGRSGVRVAMPPTKVHLVGTPFHQQDLLMSMRENPLYEFRRYAAEFDTNELIDGTCAVEIAA